MAPPSDGPQVDQDNPWPGLTSFTEAVQAYFFGREREAEELLRLVKRGPLTVLFGQSGLGKTSLLQAGLFPLLRAEQCLPVYVRLDLAPHALDFAEQVKAALADELRHHGIEAAPAVPGETLWEYFHRDEVDFWDARNRLVTPVLVLDQFEELFTLGQGDEAQRQRGLAFIDALADLIENRVPAAVARRLDEDPERSRGFDFAKQQCKVMLSFREDFLADFEGLRDRIPAIMSNRKRLERMGGPQALDVVVKAGGALVDAAVARRIIAFVAHERQVPDDERLAALVIEPSLLSVFCRELNDKRRRAGQDRITDDLLSGTQDDIIAEFYDRSVADLGEPMQRFIEQQLLTETGFRNSCALDDALALPGVARPAIDALVTRRLVRLEERLGTLRVELTHDLLTAVIKHRRDQRAAAEAARAADAVRRHAAAEAELARRRRRRRLALVGATAAVAVVAVGLSLVYQTQRVMSERRQVLDATAQFTTELYDKFRFVPGTLDMMRAIAAQNDALLEKLRRGPDRTGLATLAPAWLDGVMARWIGDATAERRLRVANTILKSDVDLNAGRFQEARKGYETAQAILDTLKAEGHDGRDLQGARAAILSKLGLTRLFFMAQPGEALTSYVEAVRIARRLSETDDRNHELTIALSGLAQTHMALDQPDLAVAASRERLALAEGRVRELRAQPAAAGVAGSDMSEMFFWQREVGFSRGFLGGIALRQLAGATDPAARRRVLDEVRVNYEQVLKAGEALVREHPDEVSARISHHYGMMLHGTYQVAENAFLPLNDALRPQYEATARMLREACRLFDGLVYADPENVWWRIVGSQCASAAGDAEMKIGTRYEAARRRYDRAVYYQEWLLKADAGYLNPLRELARLHAKLGDAWLRDERPVDRRESAFEHYDQAHKYWDRLQAAWESGRGEPQPAERAALERERASLSAGMTDLAAFLPATPRPSRQRAAPSFDPDGRDN